jgi:hypothetical protein
VPIEEMHIARVDFEEARQLADATSVLQDLTFVVNVLERLEALLAEGNEADAVLVQACWTSALVAYIRCFSTGKRTGLTEAVFEGVRGRDADAVEVHRHFKDLRDKHVAHSVNPFEQVEVGLVLSPEGSEQHEIEGVARLGMTLISPDLEGIQSLAECAKIAGRHTAERFRQLNEEVLTKGRELPIADLYATATPRTVAPGPDAASRPRR